MGGDYYRIVSVDNGKCLVRLLNLSCPRAPMKVGGSMTKAERDQFNAVERTARVVRNVWLQEREARRAQQLAANAAIRKQWSDSDLPLEKPSVRTKR